jgi:hypothetical protein
MPPPSQLGIMRVKLSVTLMLIPEQGIGQLLLMWIEAQTVNSVGT